MTTRELIKELENVVKNDPTLEDATVTVCDYSDDSDECFNFIVCRRPSVLY